jgi:hypothetical protein
VLVPIHAHSAATLIGLGANDLAVVVTKVHMKAEEIFRKEAAEMFKPVSMKGEHQKRGERYKGI